MTTHLLSCATFDDRLADYLEGDLAPGERRAMDAHRASCVRCASLVRDLEQIRTEAGALGGLTPSRDLWSGIAEQIDTPLLPLAAARDHTRRRTFERLRTAAIAAALMIATAGVTYVATISRGAGSTTGTAVARSNPNGVDSAAPRPGDGRDAAPVPQQIAVAEPEQASATTQPAPPTAQPVRNVPATVTYAREIDRLRTIFTQSRSQLDPRTVAIIESNLKVIDEAIAQSRAALAQDPASRFLTDQLNIVLDKKLDLLRTAALLPSRT